MFNCYSEAYFSERKYTSDKWEHYFEIYDHVFGHLYNRPINYLEIGVQDGGSLEVARKLFGADAKIVGLDIDPNCRRLETDGIANDIVIGDQSDDAVIAELTAKYPNFDLIVDDGSHVQFDMVATFTKLFPFVAENGIYLIEDTHTTYDHAHQKSFFGLGVYDYFKGLSERLNLRWMDASLRRTRYAQPRDLRAPAPHNADVVDRIFSIEFFDSIIAVRKKTKLEPLRLKK